MLHAFQAPPASEAEARRLRAETSRLWRTVERQMAVEERTRQEEARIQSPARG